jgi:arsenate reductase
MAAITLWHNPRCSKSREALALLRGRGVEPVLRLYLDDPPCAGELEAVLEALAVAPRELLRRDEAAYATAGLDDAGLDRAALIAAMVAQPILIQRPIALSAGRAVVGRPPARVLDLLA